jgi:hypothetical protein
MVQRAACQALQRGDEPVDAVGRQIQPEELDGDEAIVFRIEPAKYRPQGSRTNLMKNSKRTEGIRRWAGSVGVQLRISSRCGSPRAEGFTS